MDYATTLVAAVLLGIGFVLQQYAARQEPECRFLSLRIITDLLRKPRWLIGIACMVAGQLLAAWSIGHSALTLVEPLLTTYLLFALLLAVPMSKQAMHWTEVAGALPVREDAAALVKGPTGLALDPAGTLYIGDNLGNRIAKVPNALARTDSAGAGETLTQGGQLANPLAVRFAPNGNLLAANATNGKIVEITPAGEQVGEFYAIHDEAQHPAGNGDLFGIAIDPSGTGVLLVTDDTNTLALLH